MKNLFVGHIVRVNAPGIVSGETLDVRKYRVLSVNFEEDFVTVGSVSGGAEILLAGSTEDFK